MRLEPFDGARAVVDSVGGPHVFLDVTDLPHAGDDRGDVEKGRAMFESGPSHASCAGTDQDLFQRLDALARLSQAFSSEIMAAEIGWLEAGLYAQGSGQASLVEGATDDDAHLLLAAERVEILERALVEQVENDPHRVHLSGTDHLQGADGCLMRPPTLRAR